MLEHMLARVNAARAALKLSPLTELPKGQRNRSCDCVIARALGVRTDVNSIAVEYGEEWKVKAIAQAWNLAYHGGRWIYLPPDIQSFINEFDAGLIPELIDA